MKLTIAALAALLATTTLPGCMMPNYNRLIPENKDFHGMIYNPIYGWAVIDTRVPGSPSQLPPLPVPPAIPTPPPAGGVVVAPAATPAPADPFYSAILEQLAEIRASAAASATNKPAAPTP